MHDRVGVFAQSRLDERELCAPHAAAILRRLVVGNLHRVVVPRLVLYGVGVAVSKLRTRHSANLHGAMSAQFNAAVVAVLEGLPEQQLAIADVAEVLLVDRPIK